MALNTITIHIRLCIPAPANGYKVKYRPAGSDEPLRTWPVNFTMTPIVFTDDDDPAGTSYEGLVYGDCGSGKLGVGIPFTAPSDESASGGGGDESASGSESAAPCERILHWDFTEDGANGGLVIKKNGVTVINVGTTSSGNIAITEGDEINVQVNGQTGSLRDLFIDKGSAGTFADSSTSGSVSHTFTVACDNVDVTGNVAF